MIWSPPVVLGVLCVAGLIAWLLTRRRLSPPPPPGMPGTYRLGGAPTMPTIRRFSVSSCLICGKALVDGDLVVGLGSEVHARCGVRVRQADGSFASIDGGPAPREHALAVAMSRAEWDEVVRAEPRP